VEDALDPEPFSTANLYTVASVHVTPLESVRWTAKSTCVRGVPGVIRNRLCELGLACAQVYVVE
jgi:hypothetical protein